MRAFDPGQRVQICAQEVLQRLHEAVHGIALGAVTAAQWRSMYEHLRVSERHAGIQGLVDSPPLGCEEDPLLTTGGHEVAVAIGIRVTRVP